MISSFKLHAHGLTAHAPTSTPPHKPRLWACACLSALAFLGPTTAQAQIVGFNGYYAFSKWTLSTPGNGLITYPGVNFGSQSVDIRGPNSVSYVSMTIPAAGPGTWSFSWSYSTQDTAQRDRGGYILGLGTTNQIVTNSSIGKSGSVTQNIVADINGNLPSIGFYVNATLANSLLGQLSIYDFVAPSPAASTPEPSSLSLVIAAGLAAAAAQRRKKQAC
ncbi:MAG: PEP-CTERM sorting domain-containing protein [Candidatus Methylumidiphilus sp.]